MDSRSILLYLCRTLRLLKSYETLANSQDRISQKVLVKTYSFPQVYLGHILLTNRVKSRSRRQTARTAVGSILARRESSIGGSSEERDCWKAQA